MELVRYNEQSYKFELEAYQNAFPNFKYEPISFMYVEIGTSRKVPTMPSVVQPIIKPISALRGGIGLKSYTYLF